MQSEQLLARKVKLPRKKKVNKEEKKTEETHD